VAVKRSDAAEADIRRYAQYLFRERGRRTAETFLIRVEETADRLESLPGMGSPVESSRTELSHLRTFGVFRHPQVQLVYRTPPTGGIELVRVLHAARDVVAVLERSVSKNDR
jgi:plasmid stabilization system protein ParE